MRCPLPSPDEMGIKGVDGLAAWVKEVGRAEVEEEFAGFLEMDAVTCDQNLR